MPHQRTIGHGILEIEGNGRIERLREEGSARIRFPAKEATTVVTAVLINTAGGLTGGDRLSWTISTKADTVLTTQAAEKVYRSLGEDVAISTSLEVADGSALCWMPQETILFEAARISRNLEATVATNARLLIAEPVIFGRKAMGEELRNFSFRDRWRIKRGGTLIYAEDARIDGRAMSPRAALYGARAMASLLLVASNAEAFLDPLRAIFGEAGGASAWDGKLVARLVAEDGFALRKSLIPALKLLAGTQALPKVWTI